MYLDRFMDRGNMNAQLFKHELVRYYSIVKIFHKRDGKYEESTAKILNVLLCEIENFISYHESRYQLASLYPG